MMASLITPPAAEPTKTPALPAPVPAVETPPPSETPADFTKQLEPKPVESPNIEAEKVAEKVPEKEPEQKPKPRPKQPAATQPMTPPVPRHTEKKPTPRAHPAIQKQATETHPTRAEPKPAAPTQPPSQPIDSAGITTPEPTPEPTPAPTPTPLPPLVEARPQNTPSPPFPRGASERDEEGTVILSMVINTEGRIEDIYIVESSGYADLDQAAMDTVYQWRFLPASRGGAAIAKRYKQAIRFNILK